MKSTRRIGILQSGVVLYFEQTLLAFQSNNGKFGHRALFLSLSVVFHSRLEACVFAFIPPWLFYEIYKHAWRIVHSGVTQISVIDTRASTPLSKAPISKTRPYTGQAWRGNFFCHREILNDPRERIVPSGFHFASLWRLTRAFPPANIPSVVTWNFSRY